MVIEEALKTVRSEEDAELYSSIDDFYSFVYKIYPASFDNEKFVGGDYLDDMCAFYEEHPWTILVGPRKHWKSMGLYARVMYRIWRNRDVNLEGQYFSYKEDMAGYHTKKIKQMISNNKYFNRCRDYKAYAEGVCKYSWDGEHFYTLTPRGMLGFKRGMHPDDMYIDDPFQDPKNRMNLSTISNINEVFYSNLLSMPKNKNGEFRISGTPQTNEDFLFEDKLIKEYGGYFKRRISPAILNDQEQVVLWPELQPYDELMMMKETLGPRLFNQEYMCSPVYSENSYFSRDKIMKCVNEKLIVEKSLATRNDVILGLDIGKKAHPSHLVIFEKIGQRLVQVYQSFLDGVDYVDQVNLIKHLWNSFGVTKGYYDDTRSEFEAFKEQHRLPLNFEGINFSQKSKFEMATCFDRMVSGHEGVPNIELINDERQISQLLLVDNNLQAVETSKGHGDSFWSIALACMCADNLVGTKARTVGMTFGGMSNRRQLF